MDEFLVYGDERRSRRVQQDESDTDEDTDTDTIIEISDDESDVSTYETGLDTSQEDWEATPVNVGRTRTRDIQPPSRLIYEH